MTSVKKLFIAIMVAVAVANTAVLTYQETFNDVKVISPAKSTQTTCETRVDLSEGLVDNTQGCDIERIMVYNKNRMWIGSLDGVEGGYHRRYADYDVDRYKGKGTRIGIEYSFTPRDADPSNKWMVSCPKGMIAYISGEYYMCKKPFACSSAMYAIDSLECGLLPEGAHRNTTTGYSCNKGYVMNNYDYCEEKLTCGKNELYVTSENACYKRPDHAHWIKNSVEWECDDGYVLQGDICEKIVTCDSTSRYYDVYNTCLTLPLSAHWNDTVSAEWTCNDGYTDIGNGICEVKTVCPDHRYDAVNNSCYEKPNNAHWLSKYVNEWACDDGWWSNGSFCEEQVSCERFERYNSNNNTCVSKPSNSHWIAEFNYKCDDGYDLYGDYCVEINPFHLSDYAKFFHSLTFIIGGGDAKDKYDESTTLFNIAYEYNIGIRFGTDFFNMRPQVVIGLFLSGFDYSSTTSYGYGYLDESVYSMALVVGLGMGVDIWYFTIDYNYLYAARETLANVDFNSTLHQFKVGYKLNEHWNVNIGTISQLIKTTKVLKEYDNTIYNIGVSYAF